MLSLVPIVVSTAPTGLIAEAVVHTLGSTLAPFLPSSLQFKGMPPNHLIPLSPVLLLALFHPAPPDRLLFHVMQRFSSLASGAS